MDLVTRIRTVIDADDAGSLIMAVLLREADDDRIFKELQRIILNEKYSEDLRREAINSLGATWTGSDKLMQLSETGLLPSSFDTLARVILTSAWRPDVLARPRAFYQEAGADIGRA